LQFRHIIVRNRLTIASLAGISLLAMPPTIASHGAVLGVASQNGSAWRKYMEAVMSEIYGEEGVWVVSRLVTGQGCAQRDEREHVPAGYKAYR